MRFHVALALALYTPLAAFGAQMDGGLEQAVHSHARTPKFVARDSARHPLEELKFFGLKPGATVVEIWPGGGYWSEILAPYLAAKGTYYVALPTGPDPDEIKEADAWRKKFAANSALLGNAKITALGATDTAIAPQGSADLVLTFRNLHNWMYDGFADKAFAAFYTALKHGGVLGVEEHRGDPAEAQDPKAESGYVRQDYTVALAKKAGFELAGSSEIDANPKDTRHWPKGVWTLPPTYALGAVDHSKYAAIGEADNFVLKFRKP
jgi:predicted methyltransferase